MIHTRGKSGLSAVSAFFVITLVLSVGTGVVIAASSPGMLDIDVPESLVFLILISPTIAAILVTAGTSGSRGLYALFAPLVMWRVPVRWYLLAVLLPPVLNLSAMGMFVLLGGSIDVPGSIPSDLAPLGTGSLVVTSSLIVLYFVVTSAFEEIGWRGYALPALQTRLSALSSSLVIGVVWAVWHVPLMVFVDGTTQASIPFAWYLPSVVAFAVLFTWLYNNTNGSLLLMTGFHASVQVANVLLPILPAQTRDGRLYVLSVLITIGIAISIVMIYGSEDLSRRTAKGQTIDVLAPSSDSEHHESP